MIQLDKDIDLIKNKLNVKSKIAMLNKKQSYRVKKKKGRWGKEVKTKRVKRKEGHR